MVLPEDWVTGDLYAAADHNLTTKQVNRTAAQSANPMDYGTNVGTGDDDVDTAAVQAAFADLSNGGRVVLPHGITFLYNDDLVVPLGVTVSGGGRHASDRAGNPGTPNLKAVTDAAIKYDTLCALENLLIDGDGVAKWGVQSQHLISRASLTSVKLAGFTEAGFAFDAAQNMTVTDCTVRNCGTVSAPADLPAVASYVMVNGCAVIHFFNCTEEGYGSVAAISEPDHRAFLICNSVDARVGSTVESGGNRDIHWWGGIYEYGEGDYNFQFTNAATAYPADFVFHGSQLVGATAVAIARLDSSFTGSVWFRDVSFPVNDTATQVVSAAAGHVAYRGDTRLSGSDGRGLVQCTTLTGTASISFDEDTRALLAPADRTFNSPASGWAGWNTGTVGHDSTKKRMTITIPSAFTGGYAFLNGVAGGVQASGTYPNLYQMIRVRTVLANLTGTIQLVSVLSGSPFYRVLGTLSAGANDVTFEAQGDELLIGIGSTTGAGFVEVCSFSADHIA